MHWPTWFCVLVMATPAAALLSSEVSGEVRRSHLTEEVTVARVRWPVRIRESRSGACAGLQTADLQVRENGESRPVTAVEIGRQATAHLLLVDVSGSMLRWLPRVRQAAENYMDGLPPGDQVALATFGEDLFLARTLAAGLSPLDARALIPEPDELRFTALWDAVDGAVGYLDDFAGRKILILLTDGCDSMSRPENNLQDVVERAARVPGLTILPLVAGYGTTCGRGPYEGRILRPASRSGPERLARRTGGKIFDLRSTAQVSSSFARIRRRLDREGVVVYAPATSQPDPGKGREARWVRVKVASLRKGCEVESAGAKERLAGQAEVAPGDPLKIVTREGDRITLDVQDLVRDRGALYAGPGRFILSLDRRPVRAVRRVQILVPELSTILNPSLSLAERVARGMDLALQGSDDTLSLERFFIHGATFLEVREGLAAALLEQPGYGAWARRRVVDERLKSLGGLSGQDAESLLPLLDAHVDAAAATPFLASWQADMPALDVAREMDLRWSQALLAEAEPGTRRRRGDETAAAWADLRRVFGPPTEARLRTLLVPSYDPVRDVIGFVRIHLPSPRKGRPPAGRLPLKPPGVKLTARLSELGEGAGSMVLENVRTVTYRRPSRHERQVFGSWIAPAVPQREETWVIEMATLWRGGGAGNGSHGVEVSLQAFMDLAGGWVCVALAGSDQIGGEDIARRLGVRLHEMRLSCPAELFARSDRRSATQSGFVRGSSEGLSLRPGAGLQQDLNAEKSGPGLQIPD